MYVQSTRSWCGVRPAKKACQTGCRGVEVSPQAEAQVQRREVQDHLAEGSQREALDVLSELQNELDELSGESDVLLPTYTNQAGQWDITR